MSDLLFTVTALVTGGLSLAAGVLAGYLAWLTRRAAAMGADSVPLPFGRGRMEPPSVLVMAVFAVAFLAIGLALIGWAIVG